MRRRRKLAATDAPEAERSHAVAESEQTPICAVVDVDGPHGVNCGEPVVQTPSGVMCDVHGGGVPYDGDISLAPRRGSKSEREGQEVQSPITLTVTAGQEVYRPIDYHSMVVDRPLSMTVQLNGESPTIVAETLGKLLEEQFEAEFQRKKEGMLRRMRELGDEVQAQARRGKR